MEFISRGQENKVTKIGHFKIQVARYFLEKNDENMLKLRKKYRGHAQSPRSMPTK